MDKGYAQKELVRLLRSGGAHASFDDIVSGFPRTLLGLRPAGAPHSAWQLMEHLRIAQWDIVEYTIDPAHQSPDFPTGYWPATMEPPDNHAWDKSVTEFKKDLLRMQQMVKECSDILAPLPNHAKDETMLSRVLLLADHNAYHYGQLMSLRRSLEKWVEFLPVRREK